MDTDWRSGKWSPEETCKFIFFLYSMLTSPKNASGFVFWIFDARNIKPGVCVLIHFPSLQLSAKCGQNRTLKHLANVYVLSDVCVCCLCVDSGFTIVSVLFLL